MAGKAFRRGRALLLLVAAALAAIAAGGGYAMTVLTGIPDDQGVFHACVNNSSGDVKIVSSDAPCAENSSKVWWNQTGPQGQPGTPGAASSSYAFSVEQANEIPIPAGPPSSVLTLANVPAGSYVIVANIVVGNLNSPETIPVNCYLGTPGEFSPAYSARIDPFSSAGAIEHTASGASVQTVALTLTAQLGDDGDIRLLCQSNTGTGNTANASRRQITAIRVANLREEDLAP